MNLEITKLSQLSKKYFYSRTNKSQQTTQLPTRNSSITFHSAFSHSGGSSVHALLESLKPTFHFLQDDLFASTNAGKSRIEAALGRIETIPNSFEELSPEMQRMFHAEGVLHELSKHNKFSKYLSTNEGQAWALGQLNALESIPFDQEQIASIYSTDQFGNQQEQRRQEYLGAKLPTDILAHLAIESSILSTASRYSILLNQELNGLTADLRDQALKEIREKLVDPQSLESIFKAPSELADYPKELAAMVLTTEYSHLLPSAISSEEEAKQVYQNLLSSFSQYSDVASDLKYSSNPVHAVFPKFLAIELQSRFPEIPADQIQLITALKKDTFSGYRLPTGLNFSNSSYGEPFDGLLCLSG
ncbi:MAG: hypothetical protein SFU25_04535, partial [Candidatus Caenarcaniphilales bacterium]|nr:hypothetical protein [Candidatus Caenarcaniphilales bacterium]